MSDAVEILSKIEKQAAEAKPTTRTIKRMKVSDVIRQGDIYVERIEKLPDNKGKPTENRQLVGGTSQGSRHVAEGKVAIFEPVAGSNVLAGPFVEASARWSLTHPEHGHFSLPEGTYKVTHQKDYAEELRRVQD